MRSPGGELVKATRLPWWAPTDDGRISDDVRADNLAPVRQLLASVPELGWQWSRSLEDRSQSPFTQADLEELYRREYACWRSAQIGVGGQAAIKKLPSTWPGPDRR